MQKHLLYINLFAITSALALSACADEVENAVTPDMPEVGEKTPIELSVGIKGEEAPLTRGFTVIPNGKGDDYHAFSKPTSLFMLMKCEDDVSESPRTTKYSKTIGHANGNTVGHIFDGMAEAGTHSDIDFTKENNIYQRYWDDAYARTSALSIYAICFDSKNIYNEGSSTTDNNQWWASSWRPTFGSSASWYYSSATNTAQQWGSSSLSTAVSWSLDVNAKNENTSLQNADLQLIDLCYSNNISKHSESDDQRLKFSNGKFEKGEMVFYHMASKLTFIIKRGEGFAENETFEFTNTTTPATSNIALTGFYHRVNNFDVATGELAAGGSYSPASGGVIAPLWNDVANKVSGSDYTVRGLVYPTTDMTADTEDAKNAVTFSINNNKYIISRKDLYSAILNKKDADGNYVYRDGTSVSEEYLANHTSLKPGVHYIFTFVVGKSKIKNISATIADWEQVVADDLTPSNARIKLNLEERIGDDLKEVGDKKDKFTLYRTEDNIGADAVINDNYAVYNWMNGYTDSTTPSFVAATGETAAHWSTNWYWESNKHFYHFRVLTEAHGEDAKTAVNTTLSSDSKGVYLTIQAAETQSTNAYKDICWGAPMLDVTSGNDVSDAGATKPLKWYYDPETYGFDSDKNGKVSEALPAETAHQIYKAIGPTKDQIKLILFHMMSDVTFKVYTTTGDDKVALGTGTSPNVTSIELQNIYTQGNLYLGNGLVKGSQTEKVNYSFNAKPAPDNTSKIITWANYGAIPQTLEGVVLVITTADHNQYKVKLGDPEHPITATVTNKNLVNPYTQASGSDKYQINAWYPGFKYTYNFKLTKTGITDLTATVVDWENVEADEETVVIE